MRWCGGVVGRAVASALPLLRAVCKSERSGCCAKREEGHSLEQLEADERAVAAHLPARLQLDRAQLHQRLDLRGGGQGGQGGGPEG